MNARIATSARSPRSAVQFGLFGGDAPLGGDDLDVELVLLIDRDGVVLGEDVGLLSSLSSWSTIRSTSRR